MGTHLGVSEINQEERPLPRTSSLPWSVKTTQYLAVIVLLWTLIYVPGLASPPMMDDADSGHAEVAREMFLGRDFVTMHINAVRYLDKAPLLYWLNAGSYAVFGVSEFSTRLPLTLFALASILAIFWLGRETAGDECGFYSALVFATAIGPYIYTRFLIPDIMVGLWLTVTAILFLRSLDEPHPSRLLCWSLAVVTALNVLTKGMIGLVFPIAILGAYLLLTGNLKHLLRLRPFSSVAVFLAVAMPWHVLATLRNPPQGEAKGFFWFYFINEQIYRYLNKRIPHDYDKVPLLLFWAFVLVWLFPWTLFIASSLGQIPVRWRDWRSRLSPERRAALFLGIWALAVLVFFSFSTRQEYYVLPTLPAVAVLCGIWLKKEANSPIGSPQRRLGMRCSLLLLVLGVVVSAVTIFLAIVSPPMPPNVDFAELLTKSPQMYTLSMGHLFDLTTKSMSAFRFPLALTGVGLLAGTFLNWIFRRRAVMLLANMALAIMMVVFLYAVHLSLGTFSPVLGSKPLAVAIAHEYRPGDTVVVDGEYSLASSVNFYTGIQLHMLNGRVNDLWYGSLFSDSPKLFEDDASFARLWLGSGRIFFITFDEGGVRKLKRLQANYYEVIHSGSKSVFSNRPMFAGAEHSP